MVKKKLIVEDASNITDSGLRDYFVSATKSGIAGVIVVVIAVIFGMEKGNLTFINVSWGLLMTLACAFRLYHVTSLYPDTNSSQKIINRWQLQIHLYALFVGILWVALPILNPSIMSTITGAYTVILLGILTGGVYSLNRFLWAYIFYTMPIAIYLVWFHFTHGGIEGRILAALIIAFTIAALSYARNTHDIYSQSFKLRTDNLQLIKKLRNQAADLKVQKNKAETANQEKSKFLAAASHDLRQPLHALGFYLSALNKHTEQGKGQDILNKSEKSLNSLNDLLNALIGISQLDAGDIDISPMHFKLEQIIKPLIEEMDVIAEQKNIKLILNKNEHTVYCDQILLNRSIRNIIINAIKHAECSEINITAEIPEHSNDLISIKINDNGKGIPIDQLDAIFEEFHQLGNDSKDRRIGLGLGLAIVKRIAELQGHVISAESDSNGTTFKLTLPRGNDDFIAKASSNRAGNSPIKKRNKILVIDDEIDVLDSVALTLNAWDQEVTCVTGSKNALQEIKNGFSPDIIISDYDLGGKETGIDTLSRLSKNLKPGTQAFFVTGNVTREKMQEIRSTDHPVLPKPLKPQMLKNVIKQLNKKPELGKINKT